MTKAGQPRLRQKGGQEDRPTTSEQSQDDEHITAIYQNPRSRSQIEQLFDTEKASRIVAAVLTALAFFVRFYKINSPDQVVFDEVHFGKFAAYYIKREYYFDVHPPFAKLLFGLAGWFSGFDGEFKFENIGDSYTLNHVPYVGMRALPAAFGSLTIPVVYAIMKQCGYSTVVAAFSATLLLLDNAHIAQSRLILLDATLIFFMSLTMYCYIRFKKLRYWEFSTEWWTWLVLTGVCMACAWGSKVNGVLTVAAIGFAVLIDLWDILDYKKGYSMEHFTRHFMARAVGLIAVPLILYLSFFWVHFAVLTRSGPGDSFMSPAFQETLAESEMLLLSKEIRYYDIVTMRHKDTKVFLHSHPDRYPLRYEDDRISSQGQQVTGYGHNDTNNYWQIIPTKALPETGRGRIVRHDDYIQLLHVATDTLLLTHDVASPLMPTNQEFTTFPRNDDSRYNDTLFQLSLVDASASKAWRSKSGHFRLIHGPTRVALWTHPTALPDWAYKQQEVNGNKNAADKSTIWYVDEIIKSTGTDSSPDTHDYDLRSGEPQPPRTKEPKKMNFFKKFGELQLLMLQHNAGLTQSHPYASGPINWPFLISGISFWTQNEGQKQIYLTGNLVGWWTCVVALSVFVGVLGADLLARRRNVHPIPGPVRNRLWNTPGFFMLWWGVHYLPFFLMSRQLFVHHYLPSHLASALIAGSVMSFILSDTVNFPISMRGPTTRAKASTYADLGIKGPVFFVVFTLFMLAMYVFLAPLTYGTPGLTGEEVNARRLLSSWTLHFAAKVTQEVVPV
ncbi:glycosyltransferase family 39 protein [Fistulina hepatica ATCC 64428]|uniref:Dolichyl-phosphate-mannose--protein mannosyltransferase n=1 Tax=Fistulina hepatica ATCC 64428 TaxID=1128425 RepID=A0A0D7AFR7_9AGAR|nr:glycosyltransferase family 39 protein [Fistulina hepatica ATCC 64428]